eukprot:CAMPEP_0116882758 /NCGR_PEP_ID=MMETSP0463-20121206/15117_1 /TAXON_ID=181622 /ORGANISM="Strombidinopsis sp, Strain SopsisLIS2011" /LENGTH=65 /DNA_ID=CAMNT_0004536517 /DNA_START=1909 /DNA_END=2106 /DNA_ORIENTATION=-
MSEKSDSMKPFSYLSPASPREEGSTQFFNQSSSLDDAKVLLTKRGTGVEIGDDRSQPMTPLQRNE